MPRNYKATYYSTSIKKQTTEIVLKSANNMTWSYQSRKNMYSCQITPATNFYFVTCSTRSTCQSTNHSCLLPVRLPNINIIKIPTKQLNIPTYTSTCHVPLYYHSDHGSSVTDPLVLASTCPVTRSITTLHCVLLTLILLM
jgi:hypothetical protein